MATVSLTTNSVSDFVRNIRVQVDLHPPSSARWIKLLSDLAPTLRLADRINNDGLSPAEATAAASNRDLLLYQIGFARAWCESMAMMCAAAEGELDG